MIRTLFKFAKNPYGGIEIDTTSGDGLYKKLSPFILTIPCFPINPLDSHPPIISPVIFENLWQFSKVYREHLTPQGEPSVIWQHWQYNGFMSQRAIRYPKGKGRKPEYSYWDGKKLGYINARKQIYAPIYAEYVQSTDSFKILEKLYLSGEDMVLRDYDAYDHVQLGMSLVDVINCPYRKMGHSFVLIMMLEGKLEECINSPTNRPSSKTTPLGNKR